MKISIYLEEKGEDHRQVMNKAVETGIDEVGKGSIFGPVFSATIKISKENIYFLKDLGVNDSKRLTRKKRESLVKHILDLSQDWGIGQSSVREIDKFGIRYATELSMMRAVYKLKIKPSIIYIDGSTPLRPWKGRQKNIIKGDSKLISISAASILAKCTRDSLMNRLDEKYKGYLISKNKGYGTSDHFLSIHKFGLTNLHRKSFLKKLNFV